MRRSRVVEWNRGKKMRGSLNDFSGKLTFWNERQMQGDRREGFRYLSVVLSATSVGQG